MESLSRSSALRVLSALLVVPGLAGCFGSGSEPGGIDASEPASTGQGGSRVDSYIVVDFYSKKILSGHQIFKKRQVASLTKIATAMVTLD